MCSKPAYRSARSRGAWAFRNTVARYLSAEEVPRYKPREPRPTKLGAFEAYILDRMAAAAPEIIAAPALLRELRARGYDGQLRSLQAFMNAHKSVPKPDPVVRFETGGRQMQCDFVVFRRGADPLYAFTATLGFSRWRWARFTTDERAETLVACHHALFEALGGVPREILTTTPRPSLSSAMRMATVNTDGTPGCSTWPSGTASCPGCANRTVRRPGQGRAIPPLFARQFLCAAGKPAQAIRLDARRRDCKRRGE